jgi:hypothetical protein
MSAPQFGALATCQPQKTESMWNESPDLYPPRIYTLSSYATSYRWYLMYFALNEDGLKIRKLRRVWGLWYPPEPVRGGKSWLAEERRQRAPLRQV